MPPETPTTIRLRSLMSALRPRGSSRPPPKDLALALGVLEQVGVNLAHRDRQRLLLQARLYQRPDVLEDAVTELVVVVVDLTRALGGVDDQRILAGCAVEQLVDGRVGDAQRRVVGGGGVGVGALDWCCHEEISWSFRWG